MLIDDIREIYTAIHTDVYDDTLSADDRDRCEKARELLFQAVTMLAPVETKVRFPRWEYRGPTADGRRPYYRLGDKAVLDDDYSAPYTVFVDDNGKALFIRANTIEEALRRSEGAE